MESFNLNIIPGKDRPVCHASQFDIGRTIHVNLFEGFNVFTLDGTEVISISVRKPDGNVVTDSVTNTSDSYVEFVTTEQMTACHGSNLCELKLEKGADVIGTMNFILEVEQDPLDGGVQSDTQIHNLQTQVADLVAIEVADQYDSANVIFDAVPTAGHGNGYAVTSDGVKNAIDAAVGTVEDIIGDAYDENNTYNTGDYCIYSDVLYKCNADNVTGAWDATKWDAATVADELQNAASEIALKQDITDANLTTSDQTVVGAINELNAAMASITLNSNPATGDYHFDLAAGWSVTNFVFNRVGNRIYMQGVFVKTSAFTGYEAFISLSSSSTKNINPYYETWFATMCDDGNGGQVSCERLQAIYGSLRIASGNSNHRRIFVCASWISVSDVV